MKTFYSKTGSIKQRPFFTNEEVERLCESELRALSLLPEEPSAIRIDRFVEKRFVPHSYEEMPHGIMGYTKFGKGTVEEILVSQALEEEGSVVSERRVRTTLAHEAGHCLLHAFLFATGKNSQPALFDSEHSEDPMILCRDVSGLGSGTQSTGYAGRWWEFQANMAMGMLLMPESLVRKALRPYMEDAGLLGAPRLREGVRSDAVRELGDIFDVNRIVVELRIKELYPETSSGQLSL